MAKRRHRGEDSTYRQCAERWGCPPAETVIGANGNPRKVRPEHGRNCKAPWAYSVDEGMVAGRRVRLTVTAKTKADLLVKVEGLKAKAALGVAPTGQTVGGWLDYWMARVTKVRPSTRRGYESKIRAYLKPAIGHIKLQELRPEHIEAMADWMRTLSKQDGGKLSETTIRQAHMVIQSALKSAMSRRMVTYNAAEVAHAPQAARNPHEHLELDQAKAVLKAAATERELCRLVVALALGLRQGEALALRWADYRDDGDGHYLMVLEAVQRVNGILSRTDVKSRASHRRVPVPDSMAPIFEAWRALSAADYMFPGTDGGPMDHKADWTAWREALVRAGMPLVPLHGARGSAASLLAEMGIPDWQIAEILGHGQVAVTRTHYITGTDAGHRKALDGLVRELLASSGDEIVQPPPRLMSQE